MASRWQPTASDSLPSLLLLSPAASFLPHMGHVESPLPFTFLASSFPRPDPPPHYSSWSHLLSSSLGLISDHFSSFQLLFPPFFQIYFSIPSKNESKQKQNKTNNKKKHSLSLAPSYLQVAVFALSFHQQNLQNEINTLLSYSHHSLIQDCTVWLLPSAAQRMQHHQTLIRSDDLSLRVNLGLGTYSFLGPYSSVKFCICPSPACALSRPLL